MPNEMPNEMLSWVIEALYRKELEATPETDAANGYSIGCSFRASGTEPQKNRLKNAATKEGFKKLLQETPALSNALASLFKELISSNRFSDEDKKRLKTILVLQVMKAAMDKRPGKDSLKMEILSFDSAGQTVVPAYQQSTPSLFVGLTGGPIIFDSLLSSPLTAEEKKSQLSWFDRCVRDVFPKDTAARIIEMVKDIYAPLSGDKFSDLKKMQPDDPGREEKIKEIKEDVTKAKQKHSVELIAIVTAFNAQQLALLVPSPSEATQGAQPAAPKERTTKSIWPNWLAKLFSRSTTEQDTQDTRATRPGLLARWFPRIFGEKKKQQKIVSFDNPVNGLDAKSSQPEVKPQFPNLALSAKGSTAIENASPPQPMISDTSKGPTEREPNPNTSITHKPSGPS